MHLHRLARITLSALVAGLAAAPALAGQPDSVAATLAAKRDLKQFAAHQHALRPGSAPVDFPLDIDDVDDLQQASISHGFPVYTIAPKDLEAGRTDLKAMAKPTGQWRFIISLRGRPIGMSTVEMVNGRFETVAYGASVLSKDVEAMMAHHGNADRSNLRFIRIYQAQSDLLEVAGQADGRTRYAPLHSARESLLMKSAEPQLVDGADLLQPLRAAVKSNIEAFR